MIPDSSRRRAATGSTSFERAAPRWPDSTGDPYSRAPERARLLPVAGTRAARNAALMRANLLPLNGVLTTRADIARRLWTRWSAGAGKIRWLRRGVSTHAATRSPAWFHTAATVLNHADADRATVNHAD
jgi:hypothetical protein